MKTPLLGAFVVLMVAGRQGLASAESPAAGAATMPATLPATRSATMPAADAPYAPAELPGKGPSQHPFLYAGEGQPLRMSIVRDGKIVWSYTHPGRGEISDATMLS